MVCVAGGKNGRCVKQCPGFGRSGKSGRCFKSERGRKRAMTRVAGYAAKAIVARAQGVARRGVQRFKARRAARLAAMPAAPARRSMRKKR